MSHEIRTPLNGVIGYSDLLLDAPDLSKNNHLYVERISTSAAALLTIVNDILDFSRIEAGQVELEVHPFSIETLVDNAMSIVSATASQKHLDFGVGIDQNFRKQLIGDENRLRQILLNFLNNAVKFTAEGSVRLHVHRKGATGEAPCVRFVIRDTGIGISGDHQGRLFQRFSQVDGSVRREFGGSGLGLAISKHLVELMGGRIGVESAPGTGSTFWFEVVLPESEDAEPALPDMAPSAAWRSANILLVDDVEINRDIACAVLRAANHKVDAVGDGPNAIAAVQANIYDVVFMDVQMPGMDGLMATQHIRALPKPICDVPIVALTANVLPFQIEELRAGGMSAHVGKPFKRDELLAAVAQFLTDRHQTTDVKQ